MDLLKGATKLVTTSGRRKSAFAATWWYAITKGRTMDVETARRAREQAAWDAAHPQDDPDAGDAQP